MSIGRYVDCDNCADVYTARPTGWECREEARRAGWHVSLPEGRDLCPECWNQEKRFRATGQNGSELA